MELGLLRALRPLKSEIGDWPWWMTGPVRFFRRRNGRAG
ncbi:hypothetical protein CLV67_104534 [Actinoplanes italicus]|uniref:Uncharacterized protein n=1 Tax=Actinoplanes italicus TaxID=113567 RepID=A0A2T0KHU6_9ACTN|nr:hypothetical protein CLV67_104534 [Actinoplanes italicus]